MNTEFLPGMVSEMTIPELHQAIRADLSGGNILRVCARIREAQAISGLVGRFFFYHMTEPVGIYERIEDAFQILPLAFRIATDSGQKVIPERISEIILGYRLDLSKKQAQEDTILHNRILNWIDTAPSVESGPLYTKLLPLYPTDFSSSRMPIYKCISDHLSEIALTAKSAFAEAGYPLEEWCFESFPGIINLSRANTVGRRQYGRPRKGIPDIRDWPELASEFIQGLKKKR